MFAPTTTLQDSSGNYPPIFGSMLSNQIFDSTSNVTAWERCDLPKYDIWDDKFIAYVNPFENPISTCNASIKPLTFLKDGQWGKVSKDPSILCRARCHSRKNERSNIIGNWIETPGKVDCEVLEAVCSKNNVDIYGYLHTQVVPKPPRKPKLETKNLTQYDVVVILLDSLSYSQARRSLPRTISYMTEHMDAVLFPYINKVGDNSRPNGAALYFGKLLQKLDRSLFEEEDVPADWTGHYMCKIFKDNETSLFSEFQDYGYKTFLSEDWAEGTLNWPNCVGFDKPPIDHNMRPFQNAMERKYHGMNVTRYHLRGQQCREHHHTLLDYLGQFIEAYPNQNMFSWTWASILGHNSENGFPHSDNDFYKFMVDHRAKLDNSFVFFIGDHGLRFGLVRKTFIGALDVNNPFLSLSIPKALRTTTKILDIMKANSLKIQSHFDTRATILDILKFQSASNFTESSPHQIPGEKGYSFIRQQPETPRNCLNMPIPMQYCICQFNKTSVATNTPLSWKIGETITENVNEQIEEGNFTKECIEMEMEKVLEVQQYTDKFKGSTLYTAKVEMKKPSSAIFEANIKVTKNGEVKVLGVVERSNKYGNTADCIKSEEHRPYCYCRNQNNKKLPTGR